MNLPHQAKLTAFLSIQDDLSKRQLEVLHAIDDLGGSATMHEVSEYLKVPLNAISGRFSELEKRYCIIPIAHTRDQRPKTIYSLRSYQISKAEYGLRME